MMRELVGEHACEGANGEEVTVLEYIHMSEYKPLDGPLQRVKGVTEFELEDGGPVNAVDGDPDAFYLVIEEIKVRKIA